MTLLADLSELGILGNVKTSVVHLVSNLSKSRGRCNDDDRLRDRLVISLQSCRYTPILTKNLAVILVATV
jgi:hypothetical protein